MGAFNIPLSVDKPQFETPLDAQKQVLGLKQLAGQVAAQGQQQQLGQQDLLLGEQKLQDARDKQRIADEDIRDSDAIKQSYSDAVKSTPEGKQLDLNSLRNTVASKVSPRALQSFDKSIQEHSIAVAKMGTDQLTQTRELAKELANHVGAVAAVAPDDTSPTGTAARAAEWAKQVTIAKQNGLDPNNQLPTEYPGDDQLGPIDISLRGTALHLADEKTRRETVDAADKKKKEADAARDEHRIELGNKYLDAGITNQAQSDDFWKEEAANYLDMAAEIGRMKKFDANKDTGSNRVATRWARGGQKGEDAVAEKMKPKADTSLNDLEAYKLAAAADPVNAGKSDGEITAIALRARDAADIRKKNAERPPVTNVFTAPALPAGTDGKPVDVVTIDKVPETVRGTVQSILNGDTKAPAAGSRNANAQAITYWLTKVDPKFDTNRYDVKKSFENGPDSKSVVSGNTVIGHLGSMADAADKLDNTSFKKYNDFGNWLNREVGSDKTAPFRVARRGVASELGTLLKGGVASEGEVNGWLKEIDSSDTPGTLKSTIGQIAETINSRIDALDAKRALLPQAARSTPLLSDKSQKIISRLTGPDAPAAKAAPQKGAVQDGYKFLGGDPAKKENWQAVGK